MTSISRSSAASPCPTEIRSIEISSAYSRTFWATCSHSGIFGVATTCLSCSKKARAYLLFASEESRQAGRPVRAGQGGSHPGIPERVGEPLPELADIPRPGDVGGKVSGGERLVD